MKIKISIRSVLSIFFITMNFSMAQSGWNRQSPLHTRYSLMDVKFLDQNEGWAVGVTGTKIDTTDGGDNRDFKNNPSLVNPENIIKYQLAEWVKVRLEIFYILDQKIKILVQSTQNTGLHQIAWDGKMVMQRG